MQSKKVIILLVILSILSSCTVIPSRSPSIVPNPKMEAPNQLLPPMLESGLQVNPVRRSQTKTPTCDETLQKCSLAIQAQKSTIKKQQDVIDKQDKLIELQEEEIDRSHEATKKAYAGGISLSSLLLILLVL